MSKYIKCKECKGSGEIYCCNGHMCFGNGYKKCYICKGTGKILIK